MRRPLMLLCLLAAAAPAAAAAAPQWRRAGSVEIRVSSFDFEPKEIRLRAGQPVRLLLVNMGDQDHDFSSAAFFAASEIRPRDAKSANGGRVEVGSGDTVSIALVPRPGRYKLRCSNLFHRVMGMTGTIIVE
jgi:plastocyanin